MVATLLGFYMRSRLEKDSIIGMNFPFLLATSVNDHHARVSQRLRYSTVFSDYLLQESAKLDMIATFTHFFHHLTSNTFLTEMASEIENMFHDSKLCDIADGFFKYFSISI